MMMCALATAVTVYLLSQAAAGRLLFGADSPAIAERRVATCQTLSGTGALTLAAHLIKRTLPGRAVYCSDPTWENHGKMLADAGAGTLLSYRYYDAATRGLDLAGMLADLTAMPTGSIVMLHECAHNPTGGWRSEWPRYTVLHSTVMAVHFSLTVFVFVRRRGPHARAVGADRSSDAAAGPAAMV